MSRFLAVFLGIALGAAGMVAASPSVASAADSGDSYGLVDPTSGVWHLYDGGTEVGRFYYGNPGDVPFMGDWDCNGIDTPGLFRQSDAFAYLRNSNTQGIANIRFFFGNPSDMPLAGDFNGDGCDTLSIYRPSEARFYIINKLGESEGGLGAAEYSFLFGNAGDKPVVGDWDGDGIDEIGLHRESTGYFYYRNTLTTGNADGQFFFGDPGDRFVAGDWTNDGIDSPGVFRPSDTTMYLRYQNSQGNADEAWKVGANNWLPVAGRFGDDLPAPPPPPPALKRLVFKKHNYLYTMFSDGTGVAAVTGDVVRSAQWYPKWSPDGSRIIYRNDDWDYPEIRDGLYIVNADGSNPAKLLNDLHATPGDWSPDGGSIVFESTRISAANPASACADDVGGQLSCARNLFILNLSSGSIRQLTFGDAYNWESAWSPDGTRIAFTSDADNDWEIFTINVNGTGLGQVTFNNRGDGAAAWLPDSSGLVYRGYVDGQSDLWLTRFGSLEQRLTTNPADDDYPAVAADGTIAFAREMGSFTGDVIHLMAVNGQVTSTGQRGFMPDWRP